MSTEEQREEISGKLSAASTWLEDEGFGATTVVRGPLGCGRQMGVLASPPRTRVRRAGVSGHKARCRPGSRVLLLLLQLSFSSVLQMLKEKLAELRKLCQGLFFRVEERKKWPERLSALDNLLNHSSIFLKCVLPASLPCVVAETMISLSVNSLFLWPSG